MKIDLVYLWVDGSDEKWLAKKNAVLQSLGRTPAKSSISAKRWTDHDELKYSLRSVEKFANWVNHIYIITDGQTPKWLNLQNPRVSVISHSEIIPSEYLPTFNSTAIEFWLHKIPNLSEYFLYANDDMFFGKPLTPNFFFDDNGNPIVIFKERDNSPAFADKSTLGEWKKTKWNALKIIEKHFCLKYNISFKHAVEPIRKSYFQENSQEFFDEIITPSMTPFREKQNVQRMVFPMIDNAKKRNSIVLNWRTDEKRIVYDVKTDNKIRLISHKVFWLFATIFGFVKYDCYDKQWQIILFLKKYRPSLFAINDSNGCFDKKANFLNEMFINKSEFEI